jgi:hypothetical protein
MLHFLLNENVRSLALDERDQLKLLIYAGSRVPFHVNEVGWSILNDAQARVCHFEPVSLIHEWRADAGK